MMLKHVNLKIILREVEFQYLQVEAPAVSLRVCVPSLVINEHEYIKDDLDHYKYAGRHPEHPMEYSWLTSFTLSFNFTCFRNSLDSYLVFYNDTPVRVS